MIIKGGHLVQWHENVGRISYKNTGHVWQNNGLGKRLGLVLFNKGKMYTHVFAELSFYIAGDVSAIYSSDSDDSSLSDDGKARRLTKAKRLMDDDDSDEVE